MSYILNKKLNAIYDALEIAEERSAQNETGIATETARAISAESLNTSNLNTEITRATNAEVANAQNINNQGGTITALQSQQNINTATIGGLFQQQGLNTSAIAQNTTDIATKQNIITSSTALTTGSLTATASTNDIDIQNNISAGNNITLTQNGNITEIASSVGIGTSQQYYFRTTSNNNNNQTINQNTVLLYNVITYDVPSNNYNTTNKHYVVPVAGTWQFFFQAYQNSSVTTGFRLGIYKNGTLQVQNGGSVGNSERSGVILECVVGDTIDVRGSAGSAVVYMKVEFSWFEGYLLQPETNTITSTTDLTIKSLTINTNLNSETFIRTIACAKVLSSGANSKAINCSVNRTNAGRYTFTFTNPRPTADYVINMTIAENSVILDDVLIQVVNGTQTASGFNYFIHEQDNGGGPGAYVDRPSFISIFDTD